MQSFWFVFKWMLTFSFFAFVGIRKDACTIVQTDGERRIRVSENYRTSDDNIYYISYTRMNTTPLCLRLCHFSSSHFPLSNGTPIRFPVDGKVTVLSVGLSSRSWESHVWKKNCDFWEIRWGTTFLRQCCLANSFLADQRVDEKPLVFFWWNSSIAFVRLRHVFRVFRRVFPSVIFFLSTAISVRPFRKADLRRRGTELQGHNKAGSK